MGDVDTILNLAEQLDELRSKVGGWAQEIQNGSGLDTHDALCAMLDEADKQKYPCQYKYDPRKKKPPHELATEGTYSAPEANDRVR